MNKTFSVYRKMDSCPDVALEGRVLTKQHIVDLILDLAGYTPAKPLAGKALLDPGCGHGAFVISAAKRLITSLRKVPEAKEISHSLLGVEKDPEVADACRAKMVEALCQEGIPRREASRLSRKWILCEDFLDHEFRKRFDFVVGNPPYVRQEAIPKPLLDRYRSEFECFYDRADLYVLFFEKGLKLLTDTGTLSFICPNRFLRNRYGKKLRALITREYSIRCVLDLAEASPFEPEVLSYPGIYVVGKGRSRSVHYVKLTNATPDECAAAKKLIAGIARTNSAAGLVRHHRYAEWFSGEQQWTLESPEHLDLLRKLESAGIPLGDSASGCKVGIGVATGADKVYIVGEDADIESDLLLPLATTADIKSGKVEWSKRYVINPFESGKSARLVDLSRFPKAKAYFHKHEQTLRRRNVARRNPSGWYRTIDRIYPSLAARPKLLIPDIKAYNLVVLEKGKLYPHHNLYFITSDYWNLKALQTVLSSCVARFFVWMYGVRMRSGFFRFQAQYLRRICIPPLTSVARSMVRQLAAVRDTTDADEIDDVVRELYGLSAAEAGLIRDAFQGDLSKTRGICEASPLR